MAIFVNNNKAKLLIPEVHAPKSSIIISIVGFMLLTLWAAYNDFNYFTLKNNGITVEGYIYKTNIDRRSIVQIYYSYIYENQMFKNMAISIGLVTTGRTSIIVDKDNTKSCPKPLIEDYIVALSFMVILLLSITVFCTYLLISGKYKNIVVNRKNINNFNNSLNLRR